MALIDFDESLVPVTNGDGSRTITFEQAGVTYTFEIDVDGNVTSTSIESENGSFTQGTDGWEATVNGEDFSGSLQIGDDASSLNLEVGEFSGSVDVAGEDVNVSASLGDNNASVGFDGEGLSELDADLGPVTYQFGANEDDPHVASIGVDNVGSLRYDIRNRELSGHSETPISGVTIEFSADQTRDNLAVVFDAEAAIPDRAADVLNRVFVEIGFPIQDYDIDVTGRIETSTSNSTVEVFDGRSADIRYDLDITFTGPDGEIVDASITLNTSNFLGQGAVDPDTGETRRAITSVSHLIVNEDMNNFLQGIGVDFESDFIETTQLEGSSSREFLFQVSARDFETGIELGTTVSDDGRIEFDTPELGTFGVRDPLQAVQSSSVATREEYIEALYRSPLTAERYADVTWDLVFHEDPNGNGPDADGNFPEASRFAVGRNENGEVVAVIREGIGIGNGRGNFGTDLTEYFDNPRMGNPLPFSTVEFVRSESLGPTIVVDGWIIPTTSGEEPSRNISEYTANDDGTVSVNGVQTTPNSGDGWLSYQVQTGLVEGEELFLTELQLNLPGEIREDLLQSIDEQLRADMAAALLQSPLTQDQARVNLTLANNQNLAEYLPEDSNLYTTELNTARRPRLDANGNPVLDSEGRVILDTVEQSVAIFLLDEEGRRTGDSIVRDFENDVVTETRGAVTIVHNNGEMEVLVDVGGERPVDVSGIGGAFGSTLGTLLVGDDASQLESAVSSTLFSVIGENVADTFTLVGGPTERTFSDAADEAFDDFGANLRDAAVGTISSILVAELVEELGLDGVGGQFATALGTAAVTEAVDIIIAGGADFSNFSVDFEAVAVNFVATYIGKEIGAAVYDVESKEGAIGASLGASIGAKIGSAWGPIGTVIGAAVGYIIGGIIGDLFGGTPRSGADVVLNEATGEFEVTNVWSRNDGNKDAARTLATNAADIFNGVFRQVGGELLNPESISGSTYGMRKDRFTYRAGDGDRSRKSFRNANDLISYGFLDSINSAEIGGGDFIVKRALYLATERVLNATSGTNPPDDALSTILGDLSTAADYSFYLQSPDEIDTLIATHPNSAFAAGWIVTLERAQEIGLTKRHISDHFGGWQYLMDQDAAGVATPSGNQELPAAYSEVEFDIVENEREITIYRPDGTTLLVEDFIPPSQRSFLNFSNQTTLDEALRSVNGSAFIEGTAQDDQINSGDLGNDVFGREGNDTIIGGENADWLYGGEGDDTLDAVGGLNNVLFGESGEDTLLGGDRSDWLIGGNENDTLTANEGDDVLDGGEGDDTLDGGDGNDVYIFRRGDGADTLIDVDDWYSESELSDDVGFASQNTQVDVDTIEFGEGIGLEHINIRLDDATDTLIITLRDEAGQLSDDTDSLSIQNWSEAANRIERLRFNDGQTIDLGNFSSFITGTNGNDTIRGTDGADFIHGGLGDDEIFALGGDDVAVGGLGSDNVSGGDQDDLVVGGDGNDNLYGDAGDDIVSGDGGNDSIFGGAGNDTISGGAGDDELAGGAGRDVILFGLGDGRDTISGLNSQSSRLVFSTSNNTFVGGYSWNGAGGTTAIYDSVNNRIDQNYFVRDTGIGFDIYELISSQPITNSPDNDTLELDVGISLEDLRVGRDVDDLIIGVNGSADSLATFDSIQDTVRLSNWFTTNGSPVDTLSIFGFGDVNIGDIEQIYTGENEDNELVGTAGDEWFDSGAGQDVISAGAGDDIVNAGASNDIVEGGAGADIIFGGQGEDLLEYENSQAGVQVSLTTGRGTGGDAAGDRLEGFENISGSDFDDLLVGDEGDNVINARRGDDRIVGGLGDDFYVYQRGDGNLRIGERDIARGIAGGGSDTLSFGDGIAAGDLSFTQQGNDLVIGINSSSDQITLEDWYFDGSTRIEFLAFADSAVVDISPLNFQGPSDAPDWLTTSEGNRTLEGGAGADLLYGSAEADILRGQENNDTIIGGLGGDIIDGGRDRDTIVYATSDSGVTVDIAIGGNGSASTGTGSDDALFNVENVIGSDGNDVITGSQYTNLIRGGEGNDIIDGAFGRDTIEGDQGNDTILGGASDDIISGNEGEDVLFGGTGDDIVYGGEDRDQLFGNDGVDELIAGSGNDYVNGGAGNDILWGGLGNDTIEGGAGEDSLRGGHDNDILRGGAQDDGLFGEQGSDDLYGDGGNDYLNGDAGDDQLFGGSGDDVLEGAAGDDDLWGDSGDDVLNGGAGDDNLYGGSGSDFLTASEGNDRLEGGEDSDYYVFTGNFGQDTIVENASRSETDEIIFSRIAANQLWFREVGNDLIISVIGTDNQVTVENFARFRVSSEQAGNVSGALQRALNQQSPVSRIVTDTETLDINQMDQLITVMADFAEPETIGDIPESVVNAQGQAWQEGAFTFEGRVEFTPILEDLSVEVDEGAEVSGMLIGSDENDGDELIYILEVPPSVGSLTVNTDGSYTYQSDEEFEGTASAVIRIEDSTGRSSTAELNFLINPVEDAPIAADQVSLSTSEDAPAEINIAFNDPDTPITEYTLSHTSTLGNVELLSDGTILFTPNDNEAGTEDFSISLTHPNGDSVTTQVAVNIINRNDRPVTDGTITINAMEDQRISGQILVSDDDPGDTHTFELIRAGRGTLIGLTNGVFDYQLAPDFVGEDRFTIRVTDSSGDAVSYSDTEVVIQVANVNDQPFVTLLPLDTAVAEESSLTAPVGIDDADLRHGDTLTYSANAENGTVEFDGQGNFTYTPIADFNGVDTFSITATDSEGQSASRNVSIEVTFVNDAPVLIEIPREEAGPYTIFEEETFNGNLFFDDADIPYGDTFTFVHDAQLGTITFGANGSFTYVADQGATGLDEFTVNIIDANNAAVQRQVQIDVQPVPRPNDGITVSISGDLRVDEEAAIGTAVAQADLSSPGVGLSFRLTGEDAGQFSIDADGAIRTAAVFDFDTAISSSFSFNVEVVDSENEVIDQVTNILVLLNPIDEAPILIRADRDFTIADDVGDDGQAELVGQVIVDDPDAEDDENPSAFNYILNDPRFTINDSGFIFTQGNDFDVTANPFHDLQITVVDRDNNNLQLTQSLRVNVTPANEAPSAITFSGALSVDENEAARESVVAVASATDDNSSLQYSLIDNAGGFFEINPGTGEVVATRSFDFEDPVLPTQYTLTVRATEVNGGGLFSQSNVDIAINPVNENPNAVVFTPINGDGSIAENLSSGQPIYRLSGNDPDADDMDVNLTFELITAGVNNAFRLNADGRTIETARALDFEENSQHTIVVRVTDDGGLSTTTSQTINVNSIDESPEFVGLITDYSDPQWQLNGVWSLNEFVNRNTFVGQANFNDPEEQPLSYQLIQPENHLRVSSSGVVTIASNYTPGGLDFETLPRVTISGQQYGQYSYTVRATDPAGNSTDSDFTLYIRDDAEAPTDIFWTNNPVANAIEVAQPVIFYDEAVEGDFVGYIGSAHDPALVNYEILPFAFGWRFFNLDENGVLTFSGEPLTRFRNSGVFEFPIDVRASAVDNPDSSIEETFRVSVIQNRAPEVIRVENGFAISEAASAPGAPGTQLGSTIYDVSNLFTDSDGDSLTYSIDSPFFEGGWNPDFMDVIENYIENEVDAWASNDPFANWFSPGSTVSFRSVSFQVEQYDFDRDRPIGSRVFDRPLFNFDGSEVRLQSGVFDYDLISLAEDLDPSYSGQYSYSFDVTASDGSESATSSVTFNIDNAPIGVTPSTTEEFIVFVDLDNFAPDGTLAVVRGGSEPDDGTSKFIIDLDLNWRGATASSESVYISVDALREGRLIDALRHVGTAARGSWDISIINEFTVPPLVLDLNGDGFAWNSTGIGFDSNSDGTLERSAWVSADDAIVVLDRNGNGTIDNGTEISFLNDTFGAQTDLEGFVAYDTNGDGIFDINDAQFNDFRLWQDANQNGVSEAGELQSFADADIQSLDLTPVAHDGSYSASGILVSNTFSFTRSDGSTGEGADAAFAFEEIPEWEQASYVAATSGTADVDTIIGTLGADRIEGLAGDDTLLGNEGNDQLFGGAGNDSLNGDEEADALYGEAGQDELRGGIGNDLLDGGADADSLFGGDGDDTLIGGSGNDLISGGFGVNRLVFSRGDGVDTVVFSEGSYDLELTDISDFELSFSRENNAFIIDLEAGDRIVFEGDLLSDDLHVPLNSIAFADGLTWDVAEVAAQIDLAFNNTTTGSLVDDVLTGGNGDDNIEALSGNDRVNAGAGNDQVYGHQGNDELLGETGDDFIEAGSGDDTVYGGIGDDQIHGGDGNDQLFGEAGVDTIYSGTGDDNAFGGAQDDEIYGQAGIDTLEGGEGNDLLDGGFDNDTLLGQGGEDELFGGEGDDTIEGGADADYLEGGAGNDTLSGGADDDVLNAGTGDDTIYGDAGVDILVGETGNDMLFGGADDDAMYGDAGQDTLLGGEGDDILSGGEGDDVLDGGLGNDLLEGGQGNNLIRFRRGDGRDTVAAGNNITDLYELELHDIAPEDVSVSREIRSDGDNLIVAVVLDFGQNDRIAFEGYDLDNPATSPLGMIRFITVGDDGNPIELILDADELNDQIINAVIRGTDGDDVLIGTANDDVIEGLSGNDVLDGRAGADEMIGREGDDSYVVDNVLDQVIEQGLQGLDSVFASIDYTLGAHVENLALLDSALAGIGNGLDNQIVGNDNDNTLDGGAGADQLFGGLGNDTYYVDNANDAIGENTDDGADTVIASLDYSLAQNLESLILVADAQAGVGNELDNTITGNAQDNQLFGNEANDNLIGDFGNDYLDGGSGIDQLMGGQGDDTYVVDNADDQTIEVENGGQDTVLTSVDWVLAAHTENLVLIEQAQRGVGNNLDNIIQGNDGNNTLEGGAGIDILEGGLGHDILDGGHGHDVIRFSRGDGIDVVYQSEGFYAVDLVDIWYDDFTVDVDALEGKLFINLGEGDKIIFEGFDVLDSKDTMPISEIRFTRDGEEFVKYRQEISNIVEARLATQVGTDKNDKIKGTNDADRIAALAGNDQVRAHAGNDVVLGGLGDDWIDGGRGDDRLLGGADSDYLAGDSGNDSLDGGTGHDLLRGGAGNDTYTINVGDGKDNIRDGNGHDIVVFGEGVRYEDLALERRGHDLVVKYAENDEIVLSHQIKYLHRAVIDQFVMENGQGATLADLLEDKVLVTQGTAFWDHLRGTHLNDTIFAGGGKDRVSAGGGDDEIHGQGDKDVLYGERGDDALFGGEGDDYLNGGSGDDQLRGGVGNDHLYGGEGSDTYQFALGDGQDRILNRDRHGDDTLFFGEGIAKESLWFTRDGRDLVISILGSHDQISVDSWFKRDDHKIDRLQVGDHTLTDDMVDQLVQSMATFGLPKGGELSLSSKEEHQVSTIIAAAWQ